MNAATAPWVVKVGGRELVPGAALAGFVLHIASAVRSGRPVIVVHGGGEEVSARCDALGLPVEKRRGQRVTTEAVREVVAEVLAGRVNARLVNALESAGVPSVGLSGLSGRLLQVRPAGDPPGALGWVGEPTAVSTRLLTPLLEDGFTPVLAPLGTDGAGGVYNVNADLAAGAIAGALRAELVLLTDVPAVRDAAGHPLATLPLSAVPRLIAEGTADGGMIPKLEAASRALCQGARSAWIGDLDAWGADGPKVGRGTRLRVDRALPSPPFPLPMEHPHARN